MIEPTRDQIEAGAIALRKADLGPYTYTRQWSALNGATKAKWRMRAKLVIAAALNLESSGTMTAEQLREF